MVVDSWDFSHFHAPCPLSKFLEVARGGGQVDGVLFVFVVESCCGCRGGEDQFPWIIGFRVEDGFHQPRGGEKGRTTVIFGSSGGGVAAGVRDGVEFGGGLLGDDDVMGGGDKGTICRR